MYLLKIDFDSILTIDDKPYRFAEGGTISDGSFLGVFVNGTDQIIVATPKSTAVALGDTIRDFIHLLTGRDA